MRKMTFTFDDETVALLQEIAKHYGGNKSLAVRASLMAYAPG